MNVLYLSSYNTKNKAGYYYAVTDRVVELRKQKINVYNVNFDRGCSAKKDVSDINLAFPKFLNSRFPFFYLSEAYLFICVLFFCKKRHFDVIHVHWAYPIGYIGCVVARYLNIPIVLSCHGSDIHTHPKKSRYIYRKTMFALQYANKVLCVSYSLKEKLKELFPEIKDNKILVSYNGLKTKNPVAPINIDNRKLITYVGNLNYTKGADRLVKIVSLLTDKYKGKLRVNIIGDGPLKKELESEMAKLNVDVTFYGQLDREQVHSFIKFSNLIVMPSRREGFGLVALESFIYNTPCVAFDIPGLREVFKYNKLLLADSVKSYVKLCESILSGSNLELNSKKYKIDFRIDFVVNKELKVYEEI
ncbi:MAG: glycosyltransferase [Marinomonas sp.]|uniref:glycosyltransferase n=1 Tax=Marinomonas sp. TaxID=1904862 RepID=UPI003C73D1D2